MLPKTKGEATQFIGLLRTDYDAKAAELITENAALTNKEQNQRLRASIIKMLAVQWEIDLDIED